MKIYDPDSNFTIELRISGVTSNATVWLPIQTCNIPTGINIPIAGPNSNGIVTSGDWNSFNSNTGGGLTHQQIMNRLTIGF